jgi:hypothetical protein
MNTTYMAVKYAGHTQSVVDMVGTAIDHKVLGRAEVELKHGRAQITLDMGNLGDPQRLGALYTTFILWAVAPADQADKIAELPTGRGFTIRGMTPFQTFALIITAEPYAAVKRPGPAIVAENMLQTRTEGSIESSWITYRGDPGTLYGVDAAETTASPVDRRTPLHVLGARRAVEIARRAGAADFAEPELRGAEVKLAALEQHWPAAALRDDERKFDQRFSGMAHDIMRQAEHARELAVERARQARLVAERQSTAPTIEEARREAVRAQGAAASYREQVAAAQQATDAACEQLGATQTDAERAPASEQLSRAEAEQPRLKSEEAVERAQVELVQQDVQAAREQVADVPNEAHRAKANKNLARADVDQASRQADETRRERDDPQEQLDIPLCPKYSKPGARRGD